MKALLALLDLVPDWVYALALAITGAVCVLLILDAGEAHVKEAQALARAASAEAALADEKARAAAAVLKASQDARAKEQTLQQDQAQAVEVLHAQIDDHASRAAALERRLRQLAARTNAGASGPNLPEGAGAAAVVDDIPAARLSDVARANLVGLAKSANDTRSALSTCRGLLHQAWQATN